MALGASGKYTKIRGPRFQRNYIIARNQKSDLHGTSFQSSPKKWIHRMLITRCICIQWKFTTPWPEHPVAVLLTKILSFFRPLSSVHLFQKNQRFQAIKFIPNSRLECACTNHTLFQTKMVEIDTLRPKRLKKTYRTLWRRTYLYSLYKGVPPPPRGWKKRCTLWRKRD